MTSLKYITPDAYNNFAYGTTYQAPYYGICQYCWIDFDEPEDIVEFQGRTVHSGCQVQLLKEYDPLEYARAVLCLVNAGRFGSTDEFKFVAFMNVMHPTMPQNEIRQMAREIYPKG